MSIKTVFALKILKVYNTAKIVDMTCDVVWRADSTSEERTDVSPEDGGSMFH